VYGPVVVPPATKKLTLAAPPVTVPDVVGEPTPGTWKVTVPVLTVPPPLVTVALSVTLWFDVLNVALALLADVVVEKVPVLMVSECVLSLLPLKFAVPL
jgi:hypothetical protein